MNEKSQAAKKDIHGHVLFMYDSRKERLEVLAEYFGEGLAKGELCVLVTPDSSSRVIKDFQSVGLNVKKAVKDGELRIFEMAKTYLPHGKFVANYMLLNVANFILDAKSKGFKGIRTAGEMDWLYEKPLLRSEAEQYEAQISELQEGSPEFTGMCLYPVRKGLGELIDGALRTHPSFIYEGVTVPANMTVRNTASHQEDLANLRRQLIMH